MCCFSRPVRHVSATRIFARGLGVRQALAYELRLAARDDLAMILPLPVPPGTPDGAVAFVDLSATPDFFDRLDRAFPTMVQPMARKAAAAPAFAALRPRLEVHTVGAFEASFVPSPADFDRLDPRFRLPPSLLPALPAYGDHGFAVFELKAAPRRWLGLGGPAAARVHPMAFTFPRRDPGALYFPTVHVHDGSVPARAAFDHTLYAQPDGEVARLLPWTRSEAPVGLAFGDAPDAGLLDRTASVSRGLLFGELPNEDTVLRAPRMAGPEKLERRGATWSLALRLAAAFPASWGRPEWRAASRDHVDALSDGLAAGLAALEASHREAWALAPLSDDLPRCFVNGQQLWRGTSYLDGRPASPGGGGPGRVAFQMWSERVEPQHLELGFRELPSAERVDTILRELRRIVDEVASSWAA